jgi:hypothetical protein
MAAGRLIMNLYVQQSNAKALFDRHLDTLFNITAYCTQ